MDAALELATVADDAAVAYDGPTVHRYDDLAPDTEYNFDGVTFRTLPRPGGELLCRIATVNDVHFGETECGVLEGWAGAEVFRSEPGEPPYPEMMNRSAAHEIAAIDPVVVVAKGDLTDTGAREQYEDFLACYESAFGDRLVHVRGNHDAMIETDIAAWPTQLVDVPGARLAVLDTVIPGTDRGTLSAEQLAWLDDVAADAERDGVPLLVFGHHHPWNPDSPSRDESYFGIGPDPSERLVEVASRRPAIVGYFAGHTHRNRVRHFSATSELPWVEVACVKDFPGTWAEYRIYEGGMLQIHRRISSPEALAWTERTRGMFGGVYPQYSFGTLADRCFTFALPRQ